MPPEIVAFTKTGGVLTKRISLDCNGALTSDGSACLMASGTAQRKRVANIAQLGTLISTMRGDQAFALGMLRPGLPDAVDVATKRALNGGARNCIARSAEFIVFRRDSPGFVLCDFDSKGMPADVGGRLAEAGGFRQALAAMLPGLDTIAQLARASTSAGLYRADTGERLEGSNGVHVYLAVKDASDSARFLNVLHARCWLAGFGWYMIGAGGQLLERSIVDRMVGAPERLVFEGAPVLAPPLAQDKQARAPRIHDGSWLDTLATCPPLAADEKSWLTQAKAKAGHAIEGERVRAAEEFITKATDSLARRDGITIGAARKIVTKQCGGILLPALVLPFDDDDLAGKTVADVLADPASFEGETLADPLEGIEYGRCKARIMRRDDGTPWIHSFAHGRTVYTLKLDATAVQAILETTPEGEVVDTLIRHVLTAEIDEAEIEKLKAWAARKTRIGLRIINRLIKEARAAAAAERSRQQAKRRTAARTDPRPMLPVPAMDAPWLPEMAAYNAVLGASRDHLPPARNIEHQAACARKKKLPSTHAFSDDKANAALSEPPAQWVIAPLSECETAEMLERYIDFVDEDGRSVHCPAPFVKHYMKRDDGALPTIAAITTLPIVMADGHILVADGLERSHGIVFIVKDELMKLIPKRAACTKSTIGDAMRFLCGEWLVDVATDTNGKAILIALALTIIERSLLDQRPAFFVTAGKRGNGKTTALKMIMEGVTGAPAYASAWSTNEEERRKALLAYFMYGVPYILWDNVARGTTIACPHIEKSCTAAFYADRKLGVSEMVATAAATIHVFTGNNVAPKGDLASRSLQVRLDANRIDPENREFKHPDPLGWTRANRNQILQALYTVLLGNPALDLPHDAPMKTRYKMWQRIVGSAVEHAARCALETDPGIDHIPDNPDLPDFGTLFLSQEAEDEDAESLADLLDALTQEFSITPQQSLAMRLTSHFKAADVSKLINTKGATEAAITARAFLFPTLAHDAAVTPKAVGKRLKAHVGEPVQHGKETLVLRSDRDTHDKVIKFRVEELKLKASETKPA